MTSESRFLASNAIYHGDSRIALSYIEPDSVALSIWSPPYWVGKSYEEDLSYEEWEGLLRQVILHHHAILKPGGFMAINIADILCFSDPDMPRIPAEQVSGKRSPVTRDDVIRAMAENPGLNRYGLAKLLGCSEQTVQRRLEGNNIRGGKYEAQTRVKVVGGILEAMALEAGLYLYDRRVWVKDAAWENSRWASTSYRSVDEFEYIYVFWRPGTTLVDRKRLSSREWADWGSRGVWNIPSVRANDDHEAKFPLELPTRLIRLLTAPGDVVLDPFVGSGTAAVAAILQSRQFIGIDNSTTYVALARSACQKAQAFVNRRQPSLGIEVRADHVEPLSRGGEHQRQPVLLEEIARYESG